MHLHMNDFIGLKFVIDHIYYNKSIGRIVIIPCCNFPLQFF